MSYLFSLPTEYNHSTFKIESLTGSVLLTRSMLIHINYCLYIFQAMVEVLNTMYWKRVIVVYTTSVHGSEGFDTFKRQAFKSGICISKAIAVPSMGSVNDFQTRLASLGQYDLNAAIFLGSYNEAVSMLNALENIGSSVANVQWLFPDLNLMETYASRYARGALYVGPRTVTVTEFSSYFVQLSERSPPSENPWFADWYMTQYNCKLPGMYTLS